MIVLYYLIGLVVIFISTYLIRVYLLDEKDENITASLIIGLTWPVSIIVIVSFIAGGFFVMLCEYLENTIKKIVKS